MRTRIVTLIILLGLTVSISAITIDEAQELLTEIDVAMTFESGDFSSILTMISEDPETGIDKRVVRQFRRDSQDMFLLIFEEPETQRGQGYLNIDENLWFYDPESRKFSHTSMKEQFGDSDANNSDFGSSTYADDYRVIGTSDGVLGKFDVYIVELEARNNEVTYPYKKVWITRDTNLVLKTEDSSSSQRLMRTSYFPNYAAVSGKYIPTKMIFVDNLIEGKKTQVAISEISVADLPDSLYSKAYLERVNR